MDSATNALRHVFFFLNSAPAQSASPSTTAPAHSVDAATRSDSGHTATIPSQQSKGDDGIGVSAIVQFAGRECKLVDDVPSDSEDGSWHCIDTPLESDNGLHTESPFAKVPGDLTSSTPVQGGSAEIRNTTAAFSMTDCTTVAEHDVAPRHTSSPTTDDPTEQEWLSMAANTILDNFTQDAEESKNPPLNGDDLTQIDPNRCDMSSVELNEPSRSNGVDAVEVTKTDAPSSIKLVAHTTSTRAAEKAPELKQPALNVIVDGEKSATIHSSASSPSKTTPLSISAAEFVPFGPARPPVTGPAITATAAEFVPTVHGPVTAPVQHRREPRRQPASTDSAAPFFEQCQTPDRGVGLFAIRNIPAGTRLICEDPLLKIPENDIALTIEAYDQLPQEKKRIFRELHAFAPKHIDFEQEITSNNGNIADKQEVARLVEIMSIFAANDFVLADQSALGVFETASRINHSCVPNVHFSNNAELQGKETVHAARDIEAGEELLANYLGGVSNYQRTEKRQEYLLKHYGFMCKCDACSGLIPGSDAQREGLECVVWGLNKFKYQDGTTPDQIGSNPYYPASRLAALAQAEDACKILIGERLITTELAKAYRFASDFALGLGQYEKALGYAFSELNIERSIFGMEVNDLKVLGLAAEQWIAFIQYRMDEHKMPMPGLKFWVDWPEKKAMWYELRKAQKKRAAEEEEQMAVLAAQQEKKVKNKKRWLEKKRKLNLRKAAEREEACKDAAEGKEPDTTQKTQNGAENKENRVEKEAWDDASA